MAPSRIKPPPPDSPASTAASTWPDVLVLRGAWLGPDGTHPNSLLRNEGRGPGGTITFRDVTRESGLLSYFPTHSAAWADYDLDGRLDLFATWGTGRTAPSPSPTSRPRPASTRVDSSRDWWK